MKNFSVQKDGQTFAGIHLLIDFYQASNLTDEHLIEEALENAASAVNAKKIDICVHKFPQNHGVSGVITLAESHISIHTWPEIFFAANRQTRGNLAYQRAFQQIQILNERLAELE